MKKIYEAEICKFESIEKSDLTIQYIIDEKSMKTIFGNKIGNNIIDIKTGETYHILRRIKDGVLIDSSENIELNKYYVRKMKEKTMLEYLKELKRRLLINKTRRRQKIKTY